MQTCHLVGHHEDMAEARYSKSPPAYTDDQGGETASTELVQFHFNDHDDKVSRRHNAIVLSRSIEQLFVLTNNNGNCNMRAMQKIASSTSLI